MMVLHARDPDKWGAAALAARFGLARPKDEARVAAAIKHCAAYRVRADADDSTLGISEPIMPDKEDSATRLLGGAAAGVSV